METKREETAVGLTISSSSVTLVSGLSGAAQMESTSFSKTDRERGVLRHLWEHFHVDTSSPPLLILPTF